MRAPTEERAPFGSRHVRVPATSGRNFVCFEWTAGLIGRTDLKAQRRRTRGDAIPPFPRTAVCTMITILEYYNSIRVQGTGPVRHRRAAAAAAPPPPPRPLKYEYVNALSRRIAQLLLYTIRNTMIILYSAAEDERYARKDCICRFRWIPEDHSAVSFYTDRRSFGSRWYRSVIGFFVQ